MNERPAPDLTDVGPNCKDDPMTGRRVSLKQGDINENAATTPRHNWRIFALFIPPVCMVGYSMFNLISASITGLATQPSDPGTWANVACAVIGIVVVCIAAWVLRGMFRSPSRKRQARRPQRRVSDIPRRVGS